MFLVLSLSRFRLPLSFPSPSRAVNHRLTVIHHLPQGAQTRDRAAPHFPVMRKLLVITDKAKHCREFFDKSTPTETVCRP
jgi:hypothetical protein